MKYKPLTISRDFIYWAKDVLLNSSIIKKAVEEGELTIIRAVYQLENGKITRLE